MCAPPRPPTPTPTPLPRAGRVSPDTPPCPGLLALCFLLGVGTWQQRVWLPARARQLAGSWSGNERAAKAL